MIINHGEDIVQGDTILKKLTDLLRLRRHDTDESVREAVVSSLRAVAIHNLQITSDELLEFLKERLLDKKVVFFLTSLKLWLNSIKSVIILHSKKYERLR